MNNLGYQRRDFYDNLCEECKAAMAKLLCSECGSTDGMCAVDRAGVACYPLLPYWRPIVTLHHVYVACPECNPRGRIPARYYRASPDWLAAWLLALCTCADCRRERKETA